MSPGSTTTCPYCNAFVPLPDNAHNGQRLPCARCGEIFPLRMETAIQAPAGIAADPRTAAADVPVKAPRNRLIALTIFGVMVTMAGVALAFALHTQAERRRNDTGSPTRRKRPLFPEPNDSTVVRTTPDQLAALRYLPKETNLILGIHLAELRQSETGRKLLTRPLKIGENEIILSNLIRWTGVPVEEIDHLVIGVKTDDVLPRAVVVAQTHRPVDKTQVRATLEAKEGVAPRPGMTTWSFRVPRTPLQPDLWFADERTLVFDLLGGLKEVPATPHANLDFLPYDVRDALKDHRVDAGAALWFVGGIADWEKTGTQAWFATASKFARVDKGVIDRLKTVRVLALSVCVEPTTEVHGSLRGRDAAAAKALRIALFGAEDKALPEGVKVGLDDAWLNVQWKGDVNAVLSGWEK